MVVLTTSLLFLALFASALVVVNGQCPYNRDPVCDPETFITYDNPCLARRAGVYSFYRGFCKDDIIEPPPIDLYRSGGITTYVGTKPGVCDCAPLNRPVCGTDGKTYSNECEAVNCNGVDVESEGVCFGRPPASKVCACTKEYRPVCAENGRTYSNKCAARCAGQWWTRPGKCRSGTGPTLYSLGGSGGSGNCACTREYQPVCGPNQKTYANKCLARCAGQWWSRPGKCRPGPGPTWYSLGGSGGSGNCACTKDYRPVCGENGKTYSNKCTARCAGQWWTRPGKCRTGPGPTLYSLGGSGQGSGCPCTKEYRPVCGANGRTYGNKCAARCDGQWWSRPGRCRPTWLN